MVISFENAGKVTMEGKFPCVVCRKVVGINSILCQFCKCWVHTRCSGIRGNPKEDIKFKSRTCTNQKINTAEDCQGIELNGQFLEIAKKFIFFISYLCDRIEAII